MIILCIISIFLPNGDVELIYKLRVLIFYMILTICLIYFSFVHELTRQPHEMDYVD
jgi:hypothetical protein